MSGQHRGKNKNTKGCNDCRGTKKRCAKCKATKTAPLRKSNRGPVVILDNGGYVPKSWSRHNQRNRNGREGLGTSTIQVKKQNALADAAEAAAKEPPARPPDPSPGDLSLAEACKLLLPKPIAAQSIGLLNTRGRGNIGSRTVGIEAANRETKRVIGTVVARLVTSLLKIPTFKDKKKDPDGILKLILGQVEDYNGNFLDDFRPILTNSSSSSSSSSSDRFNGMERLAKQVRTNWRVAKESKNKEDQTKWLSLASVMLSTKNGCGFSQQQLLTFMEERRAIIKLDDIVYLRATDSKYESYQLGGIVMSIIEAETDADEPQYCLGAIRSKSGDYDRRGVKARMTDERDWFHLNQLDFARSTVMPSIDDLKKASTHAAINYPGADVTKLKITRCRVTRSTAIHLLKWMVVCY